jgi:hypothetical protein
MHQQFNIQQLYVLPTLYLSVLYWHVYVLGLGYFSYDLGHRTGTAHHRTFRDVT